MTARVAHVKKKVLAQLDQILSANSRNSSQIAITNVDNQTNAFGATKNDANALKDDSKAILSTPAANKPKPKGMKRVKFYKKFWIKPKSDSRFRRNIAPAVSVLPPKRPAF